MRLPYIYTQENGLAWYIKKKLENSENMIPGF